MSSKQQNLKNMSWAELQDLVAEADKVGLNPLEHWQNKVVQTADTVPNVDSRYLTRIDVAGGGTKLIDTLAFMDEDMARLNASTEEADTFLARPSIFGVIRQPVGLESTFVAQDTIVKLHAEHGLRISWLHQSMLMMENAYLFGLQGDVFAEIVSCYDTHGTRINETDYESDPDTIPKHLIDGLGYWCLTDKAKEECSHPDINDKKVYNALSDELPEHYWQWKAVKSWCTMANIPYNTMTDLDELKVMEWVRTDPIVQELIKGFTLVTGFSTYQRGYRYALLVPDVFEDTVIDGVAEHINIWKHRGRNVFGDVRLLNRRADKAGKIT